MGQMTYGVMLGVAMRQDPPESFADGWYTLFESYKPGKNGPKPDMSEAGHEPFVLGFWIAVGNGDEPGVPDLDYGFRLSASGRPDPHGIHSVLSYAERIARCQKAWPRFALHAKTRGIELGEPSLWLVQTEVA